MSHGRTKKVVLAMSGGVDSSVAAVLLKEEGYEVVGCFMRLGSDDSVQAADRCSTDSTTRLKVHHQGCCSLNDAADARLVAAKLDIPFYVLNFRREFNRIEQYFVDEYNAGRTPNPCVRCNDWLKFGKLAAYARSIDAEFTATGHYARIENPGTRNARLMRGRDLNKDQSYVLFGTPQDSLDHMLLPIGDFEKPAVRDIAERHDLPVFSKPDSQEICFVPDNDYFALIRRRAGDTVRPGSVVDRSGNVLGSHDGHQRFTIGQRRGLGLSLGTPTYVVDKDPDTNTVTVGSKRDLAATGLLADQTNWLITPPEREPMPCTVKIRYNSDPVPALVQATGQDRLRVWFDQPLDAVSPGQAAVCYTGDRLIGGGWITEPVRHDTPSTLD